MTTDYDRGVTLGRSLIGTINPLPVEIEDESDSFREGLDDTALCCASCGWWEESDNVDDYGDCWECHA